MARTRTAPEMRAYVAGLGPAEALDALGERLREAARSIRPTT
jgi:hypothetical protein